MSDSALPVELQQLITRHLGTMDHVALLLVLRQHPDRTLPATELALLSRLERPVADRVLRDLVASKLVRAERDGFQYDPAPDTSGAVAMLAEMNRTKPVTLVRAIYSRPTFVAQSFADAFRLRKGGD